MEVLYFIYVTIFNILSCCYMQDIKTAQAQNYNGFTFRYQKPDFPKTMFARIPPATPREKIPHYTTPPPSFPCPEYKVFFLLDQSNPTIVAVPFQQQPRVMKRGASGLKKYFQFLLGSSVICQWKCRQNHQSSRFRNQPEQKNRNLHWFFDMSTVICKLKSCKF